MIRVFFIVAGSFPFAILRNILLGRILSKADMGLMSLLITIISFVGPIALLGHHNAIIRFLSKEERVGQYNWKRYNHIVLISGSVIAVLSIFVLSYIYSFSTTVFLFLFLAIFATMIGDIYKEIIRAQGRYELSLILQRSERFVIPLILLGLYFAGSFNLLNIFKMFGLVYILYAAAVVGVVYFICPVGKKPVPISVHKDAFFFWGLDISLIVLASVDKLFIGKWTSYETMAVYYATFTIMRLYDLAAESLEYVLLPHSNKMQRIPWLRWVFSVVILSLAITGFYLVSGHTVLNLLFKGKYNQGLTLIPWFCVVGILRVLYIIPSSIIGGRMAISELKSLHKSNIILMVFNIIIVGIFTYFWGVIGAIAATILIWSARVVIGYVIVWKNQGHLSLRLTTN
jgi:O-antigen/teichoic acid export membrane protein